MPQSIRQGAQSSAAVELEAAPTGRTYTLALVALAIFLALVTGSGLMLLALIGR